LAVARLLSLLVPFRARPLLNPALHFRLPYGVSEATLRGWSSFPSDHAAVFFAVATCIYFVSRSAGIVALCHSFFVVCLTRVYMGLHYPTDILAGACIGVGIGCLFKNRAIQGAVASKIMPWLKNHPDGFYGLLFLLTFQIAVVFDPIREIVLFIGAVAKHVFKGLS
jgi:undecaprenyl-diphosphatase